MTKSIVRRFVRSYLLFLVPATLLSACLRCPDAEIDAILSKVKDPKTKHKGEDLKGWSYESVASEKTAQAYYYYRMPSKRPSAPLLVLVHGMFLDGRTFLNFKPLSESFEMIALELPHDSPFFKGKTTDFPELLQDFLDALHIEEMYLGGVSLGGQIAMFYMIQEPKTKVRGLALIATDLPKNEKELKRAVGGAKKALQITRGDDRKLICLISKLAKRKRDKAAPEEQEVMEIFQIKRPSFYKEVLNISKDMKSAPKLDLIAVPTVVIHGDEDSTMSFDSAKGLIGVIPDAKLVVVKGGEHDIAYTRAEEVTAAIARRFETSGGDTGTGADL